MGRIRQLIVGAVLALTAVGCSTGSDVSGVTTTTSVPPATATTVAVTTIATTTSLAQSTTSSVTTTTAEEGLDVWFPFQGLIVNECLLGWIGGSVKPNAVVTLDSHEMTPDGVHHGNPGWWQWFDSGESWTLHLEEGRNDLEFIATFEDGSTISTTVAVVCDPTLQTYHGFITGITPNGDGTYNLLFDAGRIDDQPDGWAVLNTSPHVFGVHDDALFEVYDRTGQARYRPDELAALLEAHDNGLCNACDDSPGDDCPDRCIASAQYAGGTPPKFDDYPEPIYHYIAFELLVDADSKVRQSLQLDPTLAP